MSLGQQHQHARVRLFKHLEPFPHSDSFKRSLDYSMYFIGLIAPIALIPQAWKIFGTHHVDGLSLLTFVVLGVINLLWTIYGIAHKEKALWLANLGSAILNFVIAFGIVMFR